MENCHVSPNVSRSMTTKDRRSNWFPFASFSRFTITHQTHTRYRVLSPLDFTQNQSTMALEWVVLGYAAGAEAVMVLLLTLPGLGPLRKGLISVIRNLLKPFLSVVPFCLFLFMDIYWKYENRQSCESSDSCTPTEQLRHQKSIMKSQRNMLLIVSALVFYWLLYSVTHMIVTIEQLNARIEKLKNKD